MSHTGRAHDIFAEALRRDPVERPGFIDAACADDRSLLAEVQALLEAHIAGGRPTEAFTFPVAGGPRRAPGAHDSHPRMIGPYAIREELGRGGMGIVYLADDTRLRRRVALKALSPELGREPSGRERLRREARAAAGLSHPGIATVFALEEIDDELYLVCEYVAGQSLRHVVAGGPLPIHQVVEIGTQIARTLSVAHAAGVVHRDLKPENIIRTPAGLVKVLDFGLARIEGQALSTLTHAGTILGTPAYMAPEQALGQPVDFRTDQFALGVLLYEMASGANPFVARTVTATLVRIAEGEVAPLSQATPASPPELDRIVALCLQKDPLERYDSTQTLADDLESLAGAVPAKRRRLSGASEAAVPSATAKSPLGWWKFHQTTIAIVYVLMLYPAWRARDWLTAPWNMLFLLSTLACAAAAVSLRLHLLFMARYYVDDLAEQYAQTHRWILSSDGGFAAALLLAGVALGGEHQVAAMVLVGAATAAMVAALVIEPATTRAAFRRSGIGLPAALRARSRKPKAL